MPPVDKAQRRTELLAAARDVFVTKGYHAAKVDDIVTAAAVAKGTFYLYFKDKRSGFAELVALVMQRISEGIVRVDVSADIEPQLRENVRAVVGVFLDDPPLTRLLFTFAPGLDTAFSDQLRGFYLGLRDYLAESLSEGQSLGLVRPLDPRQCASFVIGGLKEVILDLALSEEVTDRERVEQAVMDLLSGMLLVWPPPSGRG